VSFISRKTTRPNFVARVHVIWSGDGRSALHGQLSASRIVRFVPGSESGPFGTSHLGVVTAGFLLHTPVLTPVVVLLVALLHRSSLVNALRRTARTDTKTGLLNLAAWTDHATGVLSRTRRDRQPVTILFCDLDHFKTVNDTHGHLVGDQVLTAAAACLRRELRGHDGLGRFGEEEFVVILDRLKLSEAEQVPARLRTAISSLRFADNLKLTVSIGLAHHQPHHGDADLQQLLARADVALHAAKGSGRNRVHTN